jgi:hypothetical protein
MPFFARVNAAFIRFSTSFIATRAPTPDARLSRFAGIDEGRAIRGIAICYYYAMPPTLPAALARQTFGNLLRARTLAVGCVLALGSSVD